MLLQDVGFAVAAVRPFTTSTARLFVRTSDTGTVISTGKTYNLGHALHVGTTGGKPLDATVHPRAGGPPRWRSVAVAVPLEMTFHTSGKNTYVTVTHFTRASAAGAGSTFRTLETDVFRYKMGTDTDATFHGGLISGCNLQASDLFYKPRITVSWKTTSSTSAKDTTTDQQCIINSPVLLFSADTLPSVTVPFKVS